MHFPDLIEENVPMCASSKSPCFPSRFEPVKAPGRVANNSPLQKQFRVGRSHRDKRPSAALDPVI